jgi:hypothetical protein
MKILALDIGKYKSGGCKKVSQFASRVHKSCRTTPGISGAHSP